MAVQASLSRIRLLPSCLTDYDAAMKWILPTLLLATLCGCSSVVSTRPVGLAPLDLTGQTEKWTGTWRASVGACAITVADATNGILTMTSTTPIGRWRWSNDTVNVYLRTAGDWTYASIDFSEGTNACYLWGKVADADGAILWWTPDPDKFKTLVEGGVLPGAIKEWSIAEKAPPEPVFPIIGYTENGEPVYETGVPGGPSEPFTWALEVPAPEMPPSAEDESKTAENVEYDAAESGQPSPSGLVPIPGTSGDEITLGDLEPAHYELIASQTNGVLFVWEEPFVLVKESGRADLRYLRAATKRLMREQGK